MLAISAAQIAVERQYVLLLMSWVLLRARRGPWPCWGRVLAQAIDHSRELRAAYAKPGRRVLREG